MPSSHPEDRHIHYRELNPQGSIDQRQDRGDSGNVTVRLQRHNVIRSSPFGKKHAFTCGYFLGSTLVALELPEGGQIRVGQFVEMTDAYHDFLPGDVLEIHSILVDFKSGDADLGVTVLHPTEVSHVGTAFSTRHIPLDFQLFRVLEDAEVPATTVGSPEFSPRQLRDEILRSPTYDPQELQHMIQNEMIIPTIAAAARRLLDRHPDLSAARISAAMERTRHRLDGVLFSSANVYFRQLFLHWLKAEAGARGVSLRSVLDEEDRRRFPPAHHEIHS